MSKKTILRLVLGIFATLLLAGCGPCDDTGHNNFVLVPDLPADESIISSLIPDFAWHDDSSCTPDNFLISMNGVGNSYYEYALVPGNQSSYTWHESLDPGNQYKWKMRVNADNGPSSPYTPYWTFYTGPVCSGETLVAPELEAPGSPWSGGWITHDHLQEFRWSYPGSCLPSYYDYEFATDTAFTNVIDSGTTPDHQMFVEKTFPNCSTIFWRVRANHGGSVGPWSDPFNFHWVREGTECYQTHYLSDDAARIDVRLYWDDCSQTGYNASTNSITDSGCKADDISTIIVADGERVFPSLDYGMGGFEVDLGSGPCPSIGLDHKKWNQLPFNVLAPGIYCVSITRDQTLDSYPGAYLMDGIWSEPRTNDVVAYQTVEVGPGISDILVEFGWDEYDRVVVIPKFEFTMSCLFCPDPMGPVAGFLFTGQPVMIYARDWQSNWKLSEVEGKACYALIPDALIDEALEKFDGFELRSADLMQFPSPPPCPKPETKPASRAACSSYSSQSSCAAAGCTWHSTPLAAGGTCSDN